MFYSALEPEQIIMIVMVIALVLVLVVMPIFTNKKRQQSVSMLHNSLKVGDKIMTIGGIIGTVKAINQISPVDKEIVIETGVEPNKTTMILDIKALYQVIPAFPQGFAPQAAQSSANVSEVFEEAKVEEEKIKEEKPVDVAPISEPETSEPETVEEAKAEPVKEEEAVSKPAKPAAKSAGSAAKTSTGTKRTNSTKK